MDVFTLVTALLAALVGAALGALAVHARAAATLAAAITERDQLRHRLGELASRAEADLATTAALTPVRETLLRVERQVAVLERDRVEQFGELGERLAEVRSTTAALRDQTSSLVGSLQASTVRGSWGENQLRRVLEHAGMLSRCDFDEQVRAMSTHDSQVRPDVVVRLPGERHLVVDAKAPLSSYLSAQADGIDQEHRAVLLRRHAAALRRHVSQLAGKEYWSAFSGSPEMVICFLPADAILAEALAADPALYDEAQAARVVLTSPATLLAMLRAVAYGWHQDALLDHARDLLSLGSELYTRLGTLGGHLTRMGGSLRRTVESYNALVGTVESRVLVTARRLHELDLAGAAPPQPPPVVTAVRPLSAVELLESVPDTMPTCTAGRATGTAESSRQSDGGCGQVISEAG